MPQPAATFGCHHTCPMPKHPGGPVTAGSGNVFIEGKAACRQNDTMACEGTDTVAAGSATVFINGLPLARMGDPSVHGGVISQGAATVSAG